VLIILSLAATFLTQFGRNPTVTQWLFFSDTFEGFARILDGQVWRLVTPIFVHLSPMHLIFNVLMMANMGALLETNKGTRFFVVFVLVSAVVSCVAQTVWAHPGFGGMSGVIYAIFGYIWMKDRFEPHLGLNLGPSTVAAMMFWLVICMIGVIGAVANAAHVAGLAIGALWGYSATGWRKMKREFRK
jgi:GlpG protein